MSDEQTIIVFDVETTGTKKDYDQIIELSAHLVAAGPAVDSEDACE